MTIQMHKKVKITVLRTEYYQELAEQYAISYLGKCPFHQKGQVLYSDGINPPDGMCGVAWQVIAPMARQLSLGELVQPSGTWLNDDMFDEVGMVDLTGIEWIVIGTETGHRKGKAVSKPEWVWNLTHQAHALGIPVFMKEDLLPIMGETQMIQEFPPAFYRVLEEQKTWRK